MRLRWVSVTIILALGLSACASGPSDQAVEANRQPTTTTTTEAPPEGVQVVIIEGGRFRPSNVKLDLNEIWIVEWRHEDEADREYTLEAGAGDWETSPTLAAGDTFQVDFSQLPPDIYRYFAYLGNNRIPGSIDSRPTQ